jgi:hypothetical protein
VEVGDVEKDPDGSEWVIISPGGILRASRVRRYSLAHRIHAESSPVIAASLKEDVDGAIKAAPARSTEETS